jgi:hypothetical protein
MKKTKQKFGPRAVTGWTGGSACARSPASSSPSQDGKEPKRSRHRPPHLVGVGVVCEGGAARVRSSVRQDSFKQKGRSSMAGRYDGNPFEEDDVNPFSVRAPTPSTPMAMAIPPLPGRRSSFLICHRLSPENQRGIRYLAPVWIWRGRRSDHVPAIEKANAYPPLQYRRGRRC